MSIVPGLESHIHMWVISIWYQTAKKIEQTSQLQTAVHYNYNREVGRRPLIHETQIPVCH